MATIFDIQQSMEYMAGDNRYQYGRWSGAGNGTAANPGDGWHWDCDTNLQQVVSENENRARMVREQGVNG